MMKMTAKSVAAQKLECLLTIIAPSLTESVRNGDEILHLRTGAIQRPKKTGSRPVHRPCKWLYGNSLESQVAHAAVAVTANWEAGYPAIGATRSARGP